MKKKIITCFKSLIIFERRISFTLLSKWYSEVGTEKNICLVFFQKCQGKVGLIAKSNHACGAFLCCS